MGEKPSTKTVAIVGSIGMGVVAGVGLSKGYKPANNAKFGREYDDYIKNRGRFGKKKSIFDDENDDDENKGGGTSDLDEMYKKFGRPPKTTADKMETVDTEMLFWALAVLVIVALLASRLRTRSVL